MTTVYAIKSRLRNYIYVGMTGNLNDRLTQHARGYSKTTKPYRPFRLIYSKVFRTRFEARAEEKRLKSGIGKEWLRSLQS
ncbi:MAG: GIY-YIG nuclease family protein [Patescibacteria group bacterium]|nr:GIY-YIG nuclease family protein [Patescibacteria group bacterium]MDD5715730.1 GIY-YIG nuclease family protein [Patescibacteria group bacterium]